MYDRYTKLSSNIITSSIWVADLATFKLWIMFLAMMDSEGFVSGTKPGLRNISTLDEESFEQALTNLMSPDPNSRTKEHEGRRVKEVDGGYLVLNAVKYDEVIDLEKRRKQAKERKRKQRELAKNRKMSREVTQMSHDVTRCHDPQPQPQPQPHIKEVNKLTLSGKIPDGSFEKEVLDVLEFFNEKTNRRFTYAGGQTKFIRARLREQVPVESMKLIIEHRCCLWSNNGEMKGYLRPQTLFSNQHFEDYLEKATEWDNLGRPEPQRKGFSKEINFDGIDRAVEKFKAKQLQENLRGETDD